MDNQQATQTDLAWLAGIIDGEGYVTLAGRKQRTRPNYIACLEITNTEALLIQRVQRICGQLGVHLHLKEFAPRSGCKVAWKLEAHRFTSVGPILVATLPYLTGKARRAIKVLDFIHRRQSYGEQHPPYTPVEYALVVEVQDLVRNGESSQAIRETLRRKPQR